MDIRLSFQAKRYRDYVFEEWKKTNNEFDIDADRHAQVEKLIEEYRNSLDEEGK